MKANLLFFLAVLSASSVQAQTVWSKSNGTITFTKAGFADWTQAVNQDRISDSVWITRASSQAIFNIRKESAYQTSSPIGTSWALGTTANYSTLTYTTFIALSGSNPTSLIGKDLVVRLLAENIYADIKLLSYGSGGTGADFSYTRAASAVGVSVSSATALPASCVLHQNYPNPFNPTTTIEYQIPPSPFSEKGEQGGFISLKVFDILGREAATLVNEELKGGILHQRTFDASALSSGLYFYRLESNKNAVVKKLLLMR